MKEPENKRRVSKNNIGNAGEYYVASRLSAEDFMVTITLGRAEKYDIIAVNPEGKTYKLSVKTRFDKDVKRFPLGEKDERGFSADFFYAFVMLNEFKEEPDFWIIPSKEVTKILYDSHRYYLNKLGKKGQQRKDSTLRNLWMVENSYVGEAYPKNWEKKLKNYYKNIKQLKK